MSHSYAQVLICQSTGVAVVGVYPILFPPNGYHGQLGWMANSCSLLGPQSYTALLNASQEGPLKLPRHIALKTSSGATINIGAALTTPSSKKLSAKLPLLSVHSLFPVLPGDDNDDLQGKEGKDAQQVKKPSTC